VQKEIHQFDLRILHKFYFVLRIIVIRLSRHNFNSFFISLNICRLPETLQRYMLPTFQFNIYWQVPQTDFKLWNLRVRKDLYAPSTVASFPQQEIVEHLMVPCLEHLDFPHIFEILPTFLILIAYAFDGISTRFNLAIESGLSCVPILHFTWREPMVASFRLQISRP
jgi:hypothetical protein